MEKDDIKRLIEEFLGHTAVSFDKVETIENDLGLVFMITTEEPYNLIGNNGSHLSALNHLIKKIIERKTKDSPLSPFSLDINNYQQKKNQEIKNKAIIFANRVKSFGTNKELEPMSSYERMIVHAVLADDPDVQTESTGYGKDRRVVIKYVPPKNSEEF